jgi:hypothetical protein
MSSIRNLLLALGCTMAIIAAMKPAGAATITYDVIFSATDFAPFSQPGVPPYSLVMGQFHVSFDPTVDSGGYIAAFDFILPSALLPSAHYHYTVATDTLTLGGLADIVMSIRKFTTSPYIPAMLYAIGSGENAVAFVGSDTLVHVSAVATTTTPIPAALPLFAAALGGLGIVGWRRRRLGAPAA